MLKGTGEDEIGLKLIQTLPAQAQYHFINLTENAVNQNFWLLHGIIWQQTGKDAQF